MANRVRPKCPDCGSAMGPIYAHGPRGKAFVRIRDAFYCPEDGHLARGRRKARIV